MRVSALIILIFFLVSTAVAGSLPHYPSTYRFSLGYTFTKDTQSGQAVKHHDVRDTLGFGAVIETYPLPQRFYLELDFLSTRNLYLDADYAYKDLLLTRLNGVQGVRNIENPDLPLQDPDAEHRYFDQTPENYYTTKYNTYELMLRLKAPNYPFHVFGRYIRYEQKETTEQRYLISGFFTDMEIHTEERHLERKTETFTAGTNSHIGPIEAEYTYLYKTFNPSGRKSLSDTYPDAVVDNTTVRQAGEFTHNLYPEFRSQGHTIKFHTSYTGRIVASATAMFFKDENNYSSVTRDTIYLGTGIRYLPSHYLTLSVQTTYKKKEQDSPQSVTIKNIYTYNVRQAPETETATIKTAVRVRPYRRTNILLGYTYKNKNLSGVSEWPLLKGDGQYNSFFIKVFTPFSSTLHVRAQFSREENDPVYNTEPESANNLSITAQTKVRENILPTFFYHWRDAERKDLTFVDPPVATQKRTDEYHQAGVLVGVNVNDKLSITPSLSFRKTYSKGPLVFFDLSTSGYFVYNAQSFKEEAVLYGIDLNFKVNDIINSSMLLTYTTAHSSAELSQSVSDIGRLMRQDYRLFDGTLNVSIKTLKDVNIKPQISYIHFKDKTGTLNSGDSYQAMLFIEKQF